MPDSRAHRGPDPRDDRAFAPESIPVLQIAAEELSWLLGRGYTTTASLKLVGDHWSLDERQRKALARSACPDSRLAGRLCRRVDFDEVEGEPLLLDGFNLLTTLEAALGGAVVLVGRDGALRDIAGVHGTYRKVEETIPAAILAGEVLEEGKVSECHWLLDAPVSNSGRLAGILRELAESRGWSWKVDLVNDPDPILAESSRVVVTADSVILDRVGSWLNLARTIVAERVPNARVIDLSAPPRFPSDSDLGQR